MARVKTSRIVLVFLVVIILASVAYGLSVSSFFPNQFAVNISLGSTQKFNVTVDNPLNVTYVWTLNGAVAQNSINPEFLFSPSAIGQINISVNATENITDTSVLNIWNATILSTATSLGLTSPFSFSMGSDDIKASNPTSEDTDAHNRFAEASVLLKNTDSGTVTAINATIVPLNGFVLNKDLNFTTILPSTTLNSGDSISVNLRSRISEKLDAANESNFKLVAPDIVQVIFSGTLANGTLTQTSTIIKMQRKNQLIIKDIDVCVETDCEDVGNGEKIDNIVPGDRVEFEITVENLYSTRSDEDLDIEDIDLEFDIDEDDFSEDDSQDIGDLGPRDEETHVFTFDIPDDIDSSVYDVILTLVGKDEHGAAHADFAEFKLDIDRKSHDVQIKRVVANPSTLSCKRSTTISVDVQNIGENSEDETVVTIKNDELNLNKKFGPFDIEEDEKRTDAFVFELPDFAGPGSYTLVTQSFFDVDKQTDEEGAILTVKDCEEEKKDKKDETAKNETQQKTVTQQTQSQRAGERTFSSPTTSSDSGSSSAVQTLKGLLPVFLAIISGLIVLLVITLIVLRRR